MSEAEPRLQRRYGHLVVSQLSSAHRVASGVHAPPTLSKGFATTQAAWRFYSNERVTLPGLCRPLVEHACSSASGCCHKFVLGICDWSNLHYNSHESKPDRVALSMNNDLGYELFTALAVSDRDGSPIAPLCLELRAKDGLHTTRSDEVLRPPSQLDAIAPVMGHLAAMPLGKPVVFIVDREADSVAHYRNWDAAGRKFVVRADDTRKVLYQGKERTLRYVARQLRAAMKGVRAGRFKSKTVEQFVTETTVVLDRPAYQHRVDKRTGKKKHKVVPGPALALRLVVAELRDHNGKVLANWLLLSNLAVTDAPAATIALWYYWRWRIESYHKLLKSAGQQIEQWQQESAASLVRRLLVTAMSAVLVWQLARDPGKEAKQLRETLIRLSGRQTKRSKGARGFTEPALLAGLCVLMPMLLLLEQTSLEELKAQAQGLLPLIRSITGTQPSG